MNRSSLSLQMLFGLSMLLIAQAALAGSLFPDPLPASVELHCLTEDQSAGFLFTRESFLGEDLKKGSYFYLENGQVKQIVTGCKAATSATEINGGKLVGQCMKDLTGQKPPFNPMLPLTMSVYQGPAGAAVKMAVVIKVNNSGKPVQLNCQETENPFVTVNKCSTKDPRLNYADVSGIIIHRCASCHNADPQQNHGMDFTKLENIIEVQKGSGIIAAAIQSNMPFGTRQWAQHDPEGKRLLTWLQCGEEFAEAAGGSAP